MVCFTKYKKSREVIFHLVEQWKEGIVNALDFTRYMDENKYHIGVIIRNFDSRRIDEEIVKCEQELGRLSSRENIPKLVLIKNYPNRRIAVEKELEILKNFKNIIFYKGKERFSFECKMMDENNHYKFVMKY